MNSMILGTIIGFIMGAISVIALYFYLLFTYEEVDLHHSPIPTLQSFSPTTMRDAEICETPTRRVIDEK